MDTQKKILIIEDDEFLRSIYATYLSQKGFQISEAVDGQEGQNKTEAEPPDFIVLDLMLPALNGFEVLTKVRSSENPIVAKIPIIILSNVWEEDDVKKAFDLGIQDYLLKANVTPQEIYKTIKHILGEEFTDIEENNYEYENLDQPEKEKFGSSEDMGIKVNQ